ncbi:MAG: sensor histidine kinase [Actinomycetota bacterium]
MPGPRALSNVAHGSPAEEPVDPSRDVVIRLDDLVVELARTEQKLGAPATPGVAWMAHEIRGPLIVARATIERALSKELLEENRDMLSGSLANLERLMHSVDRILDWVCGGLVAGRRAVDLTAIARSAAEESTDDRERIRFDLEESVVVLGDETRLGVAVSNLVRNAVKYSPAASTIRVLVERSGAWATLRVEDEGPGVPEDEREAIFTPLVRGRAGRRDGDGRGLGLFIARQAVEELGGSIGVEPVGSGSSFVIRLPIAGKAGA